MAFRGGWCAHVIIITVSITRPFWSLHNSNQSCAESGVVGETRMTASSGRGERPGTGDTGDTGKSGDPTLRGGYDMNPSQQENPTVSYFWPGTPNSWYLDGGYLSATFNAAGRAKSKIWKMNASLALARKLRK